MKKSAAIVLFSLVILCLLGQAFLLVRCLPIQTLPEAETGTQWLLSRKYTAYIGINDQDANESLLSPEEASALVNAICMRHTGGFTQAQAKGHWQNDAGIWFDEPSLVYVFYDISPEALGQILDETLAALNQSSILVEAEDCRFTYYDGTEAL